MRRKVIAGNWKMNMTPSQAVKLVTELKPNVNNPDVDVVFCVPSIDIVPVVVAEGILTDGRKRAAEYIAQEIEYETGIETRETVLGYIQRGGSPTPFDRNLSTRMGGHATELIANGQFGRMIALKGDDISSIPLEEVAGKLKLVTEDHDLVIQGRRLR